MSYAVELTPSAERDLAALPPLLHSHALDQLDRLASDPVRFSRRASFPHPPHQKYQFTWPPDAPREAEVTVLFRYSQDETTIEIVGIGVVYYR
jgi:hypothetical protein